jgi:multidrug efflux system membrane fusion protein
VLEQARVELERTRITAPFSGRVRNEDVDVGGFIARGNAIARIYSVDVAEVRLPLASDELAYLDLPLGYLDASDQGGPEVQLYAEFGGRRHRWQGRIVRTEGEIDPGSRMVHVVAQVDEPYSKSADDPDRPPLAVGMFVDAEIAGRHVDGVFVLPRGALRGGDRVLVIDEESRLRMRSVRVLRAEEHRVIVGDGLDAGERVCISALEVAVDGMLVRIVEEEADSVPDGTVDGQESGA